MYQRRMSMSKFRACYHAMAGTGQETEPVLIEDVEALVCDWPMTFGEFYEVNRDRVQLYEEVVV